MSLSGDSETSVSGTRIDDVEQIATLVYRRLVTQIYTLNFAVSGNNNDISKLKRVVDPSLQVDTAGNVFGIRLSNGTDEYELSVESDGLAIRKQMLTGEWALIGKFSG